MRTLRILFIGESSFLATGYATYAREVLSRLHATDKYELAELGCFGDVQDRRAADIPWRYFPNMPDTRDPAQVAAYNAKHTNIYGEWRFEETCLAFKPDIVFDPRDWWMLEAEERSPYRRFFHWAVMPTVDSAPQDEQWLATYLNADSVFTYSDWGLDVLNREGRGRIKTICSAPPGADLTTLSPVSDRAALKVALGLKPDSLVVGTVMRNQKRKLYPDLCEAFATYLRTAPSELARRTYLYLHTSYPDVGWDLPRLIKEHGLGARTLWTYRCNLCGCSFPSFFQDARGHCPQCGSNNAGLPTSNLGVAREILAKVYNLMDAYVQYSICEGFGMPMVEAAACGVPVFAVDYSAMADVVRKLNGYPVRVQRLFRECETHTYRALPDNDDLAEQLIGYLGMPRTVRASREAQARQGVEEHYTYDRTAQLLMNRFDQVQPQQECYTWNSQARLHRPVRDVPANMTDEQFVRWGMEHVAGRPDLVSSYTALRMMRDLNWMASIGGTGGTYINDASATGEMKRPKRFSREDALQAMLAMATKWNEWEERRTRS